MGIFTAQIKLGQAVFFCLSLMCTHPLRSEPGTTVSVQLWDRMVFLLSFCKMFAVRFVNHNKDHTFEVLLNGDMFVFRRISRVAQQMTEAHLRCKAGVCFSLIQPCLYLNLARLRGTFRNGLKMSGHLNNTTLFPLLLPEQQALQEEQAKLHPFILKGVCVSKREREGGRGRYAFTAGPC